MAKQLGLETGGFVPKGCRTDEGPAPELVTEFGCVELLTSQYAPRTIANVRTADATVWFGTSDSAGYTCTAGAAGLARKPFTENPTAASLRWWLGLHGVSVLNVAGNRRRTNPRVVELTRVTLLEALGAD